MPGHVPVVQQLLAEKRRGWRETEVEARAAALAVGSVVGREALRMDYTRSVEGGLCARGDRWCCGERPKWREARAEARAVRSVVGRGALRECVFASGETRRRCCVPAEKEGVVREHE